MTNFIPIFPLGIVVFPGEELNLHIFEDRYKELITESHNEKKQFGIPTVINNRMMEYGTLLNVTEVFQVYKDGKMDIRTRGLEVFKVLEVVKEIPGKLYSGAIVTYPGNLETGNRELMLRLVNSTRELHRLLNITKNFKKADDQLNSYDLAHHTGMNLEEEYEFLQLSREDQRQEYLKRHLGKVLPVVAGMDALKEKVKLNGHFMDLKGFEF